MVVFSMWNEETGVLIVQFCRCFIVFDFLMDVDFRGRGTYNNAIIQIIFSHCIIIKTDNAEMPFLSVGFVICL